MKIVLLFLLCCKLSSQLNKDNTEKLLQWGVSKKIQFHPYITLKPSSKQHPFPYFNVNGYVSTNDTVITVPSSMVLNVDKIIKNGKNKKLKKIYEQISNCTNEYIQYNSTKEMVFVALVVYQYKHLLNKNSTIYKRFKNYFHIYKDTSFDNFPLFYNEDELSFFHQTNFDVNIRTAKSTLEEEVSIIENELNIMKILPDEYLKYRLMILSNTLLINNTLHYIPFVECFPKSHIHANAKWIYNNKTNSFEIIALRNIKKDEKIILQNRPISNAMMLVYYGYTEEHNNLIPNYFIDMINNLFRDDMKINEYINVDDLPVFDISKETFEKDAFEAYHQLAMKLPSYSIYQKSGGYRLMKDNLEYHNAIYSKYTPGELNKNLYSEIKVKDAKRILDLERDLIVHKINNLNKLIQEIESEKSEEVKEEGILVNENDEL